MKEKSSIHSDSDRQGATAALIGAAKKVRELDARTRTVSTLLVTEGLYSLAPLLSRNYDQRPLFVLLKLFQI